MKVLFDAGSLMKDLTGIGVYASQLLHQLISIDRSVHYYILFNALKGETPRFEWQNDTNVTIIRTKIPGKLLLELWRRNLPPAIETLAGCKPDVFHSPNFFYQNTRTKHIVATIHDIAFFKKSSYGDTYSGAYHRKTLLKRISKISHFVVVSDAVRSDLIKYLEVDKKFITVIHHGINPMFMNNSIATPCSADVLPDYPENYILFVGTIEPRKNLPLLIKAYKAVADIYPDIHLVIAGRKADGLNGVAEAIHETQLESHVHLKGFVRNDCLVQLYRRALLTVFPSWDEGFGFPPLEAMASGARVLVSDIPVHKEILGPYVDYFTSESRESLQSGMLALLSDPVRKNQPHEDAKKHAMSFSWQVSAEKHLEVYRKVLSC